MLRFNATRQLFIAFVSKCLWLCFVQLISNDFSQGKYFSENTECRKNRKKVEICFIYFFICHSAAIRLVAWGSGKTETFIACQLGCLFSLASVWIYSVYAVCLCAVVMPVANRLILSCGYPRLSAAKCWAICVVCCLASNRLNSTRLDSTWLALWLRLRF